MTRWQRWRIPEDYARPATRLPRETDRPRVRRRRPVVTTGPLP